MLVIRGNGDFPGERDVVLKARLKANRHGDQQAVGRIADFLRAETAQTLGYVGIQLAALASVDDLPELHERILEIRGEVRHELRHILALVDELEKTAQA